MAGAVANKCAANIKAISYLQMQGIPVLYDLRHFENTLLRGRYVEKTFCRFYVDRTICEANIHETLKVTRSIVRAIVPSNLIHYYEDELLSLNCFLGRIFKSFSGKKLRMSHINSNVFKGLGAVLAQYIHPDAEEAFEKFKELHDPKKAVTFMATLTAVRSQLMHAILRDEQKILKRLQMMDDDDTPGPSQRARLNN
ncbi:uncharacterized protein Dana_GF27228 [Drosophila ananassae]|uniref:Uncharacterized protein n=2 Tax=Drosophila ananassae TaxID=7217 RepID=A0A0P8XW90_DROAN|nr:uncharacterized protein Dana_GF27228 [Drosophila ananassae]